MPGKGIEIGLAGPMRFERLGLRASLLRSCTVYLDLAANGGPGCFYNKIPST